MLGGKNKLKIDELTKVLLYHKYVTYGSYNI